MFKLFLSLFLLSVITARHIVVEEECPNVLPAGTYNIAYIKDSFPGFQDIVFTIDGNNIGFTGCNINRGTYELTKDNKFTTTPLWLSTRRACPDDYDGVVLDTVLKSDEAYGRNRWIIFTSEGDVVLVLG